MSRILWQPSENRIKNSNMFKFMKFVNERFGLNLKVYDELYHWSVRNISEFWAAFWDFAQIRSSKPFDRVVIM